MLGDIVEFVYDSNDPRFQVFIQKEIFGARVSILETWMLMLGKDRILRFCTVGKIFINRNALYVL